MSFRLLIRIHIIVIIILWQRRSFQLLLLILLLLIRKLWKRRSFQLLLLLRIFLVIRILWQRRSHQLLLLLLRKSGQSQFLQSLQTPVPPTNFCYRRSRDDDEGNVVPQNIHTRGRKRKSCGSGNTTVVPNPLLEGRWLSPIIVE